MPVKLDKKSRRNLDGLDLAIGDALQTMSKHNVFKSDLFRTGKFTEKNTEENRQMDLNMINRYKNRKMSCRIVHRVYKKYHIYPYADKINALKKVVKKHPISATPLHDLAQGDEPNVVMHITPVNGHRLPVIGISEISKTTFAKVIRDMRKLIHKYLPPKDYKNNEKMPQALD